MTATAATASPLVLVTGASRGIGLAVARELADDHTLLLGGRDADALRDLARTFPAARPVVADLTDPDGVAEAVAALDLDGGLAAVVHSAGILVPGRVEELTAADWARSFAVNVTAVADLTRLLLPALRLARGTVVTVNSGSGFTAGPGTSAYSASKFALRAFSDALRAEEAPHGVRVSSVHPGRVDTDMQHELRGFERGEYEPARYLRPESVARAVGLAVRATDEASLDVISVRPRG